MLPGRLDGFTLASPGLRAYRLSLVFRLRNAIQNGLSGTASEYVVEIVQARRGSEVAMLIDVGAAAGSTPPAIPEDVRRLIDASPLRRLRLAGASASVYRTSDTHLVVVAIAADRAAVAMAPRRRTAVALARAVATVAR